MLTRCSLQPCPQKFNHPHHRRGALRASTETSLANLLQWQPTHGLREEAMFALLPSVILFLVFCLLVVKRKVIPCAQSSKMTVRRMLSALYLTLQTPNLTRAYQSTCVLTARLPEIGPPGRIRDLRMVLRRWTALSMIKHPKFLIFQVVGLQGIRR
jgi:hypothetical protein